MLQRRDYGVQATAPVETPAVAEVDWNSWWLAIDKRVQEHLVNERKLMIDAVGEAMATHRRELYEDGKFRGPPGRPGARLGSSRDMSA